MLRRDLLPRVTLGRIAIYKADVPKLSIATIWTPLFERYMIRCQSKNGHQKDKCLKETGLHVQYMLIILGSMVNMITGTYMAT